MSPNHLLLHGKFFWLLITGEIPTKIPIDQHQIFVIIGLVSPIMNNQMLLAILVHPFRPIRN
jgi:hypothetical protein